MTNQARVRAAVAGLLLFACGVAAFYAHLRRDQALATLGARAATLVAPAGAIHFEPLQIGSRIKAEVSVSGSAKMHSDGPVMIETGPLALDTRLRGEIKVLKVSEQSLEEIELTLTTLSLRTELSGELPNNQMDPPQTYDITLSGPSPTIRAQSRPEVYPMERVKIALFVVPLAEFYAHWAGSPTLELKPGWSRKVPLPLATTLFATAENEVTHAGPLRVRFTSRLPASEELPFELALPVAYANDLGKVSFELTGSAQLDAKSGRPTELDLSGPLSATRGTQDAELSISGTVKLTGTIGYP